MPGLRWSRRGVISLIVALMGIVVYFVAADLPNILTPIPADPFRGLKGGSWLGYRTGYYGSLLFVASMFYSLVKRLPRRWNRRLGGSRRWLNIHIWLAVAGSLLVLIHAGCPFDFRYGNPFRYIRLAQGGVAGLVGFAGLATTLIPFILISGVVGRYLFRWVGGGAQNVFRYWHALHIVLTGGLYGVGLVHLILVVWFRFVTL